MDIKKLQEKLEQKNKLYSDIYQINDNIKQDLLKYKDEMQPFEYSNQLELFMQHIEDSITKLNNLKQDENDKLQKFIEYEQQKDQISLTFEDQLGDIIETRTKQETDAFIDEVLQDDFNTFNDPTQTPLKYATKREIELEECYPGLSENYQFCLSQESQKFDEFWRPFLEDQKQDMYIPLLNFQYEEYNNQEFQMNFQQKNSEKKELEQVEDLNQVNQEQDKEMESVQKNPYRSFTTQYKKEIISKITEQKQDIKEVSQMFNIPVINIKRWMKNGPQRREGGGRKTQDPQMEEDIKNMFYNKLNNEQIVMKRKDLIKKAMQYSSFDNFKGSKGWYDKFTLRYPDIKRIMKIYKEDKYQFFKNYKKMNNI